MQTWTMIAVIALSAVNTAGFAVCAADKRAAITHRRRVRESTLFALALAGGAAGVYLAMLVCRHKTRKKKFAVLMPLILIVQAALFCWLFLRGA